MRFQATLLTLALGVFLSRHAQADSPYLYGIHWWGYTPGQAIDSNPATLLDAPTYGGWSVETIITHSVAQWQASYFTGLYSDLPTNKNVSIITRIDYNWGETVPSPSNPDAAGWPDHVVNQVVNVLKDGCHIWQIGNEPNLTIEGNNWPDNKIQPADYAQIYRNVRNAIHNSAQPSPLGPHIVLVAPVSPGGIINFPGGQRWKDGNQWTGEVIDNIPNDEIDGFGLHAYGGSITDFRNSYSSALAVIDGKGLQDRPVYMTEFAKDANLSEASKAQFIRDAYADVHAWNQTPGNHDIVCLAYFVYDFNQQASGAWNNSSIEYSRTNGEPLGDPDNMYTAFEQTVDLRYPAGEAILPPIASFSAAPTLARVGQDVSFANESTGTVDTWSWMFGDGNGSGSSNPDHAYTTPGVYGVTLEVSGPRGNDSFVRNDYITVIPRAGDMDGDDDGDMEDYGRFQACFSGNGNTQADPDCVAARMDSDDDVDATDLQLFLDCLSGKNLNIDPACAP